MECFSMYITKIECHKYPRWHKIRLRRRPIYKPKHSRPFVKWKWHQHRRTSYFFFSFDRKTISIVEGGVGLIAAGNNARGELIVWFYSYGEMKSEITNKLAPIRLFITAVIVAAKQSIVSSGEHRWFQLN